MPCAIITRDGEAAAPYAAALAALGLETIVMPVTRIERIGGPQLSRLLVQRSYWAIACASANAAEALVDAWNHPLTIDDTTAPEVDLRGRALLPDVWAVGPATARVLTAAGIGTIVEDGVRDAATLGDAMVARGVRERRILIPRAEDGRRELINRLQSAGAQVDAVDVYRSVPIGFDDPSLARAKERFGDVVVICVFAPSQVHALASLMELATVRCRFVAIGETTALELLRERVEGVVTAASSTPEGLAKAVATVYPATR